MNKFTIIPLRVFFIFALFALFLPSISCKKAEEVALTESGNAEQNETGEVKEGESDTAKDEAKEEEKKEDLPPPTAKEIGYAYGAILAKAVAMNHLEIDAGAVYKGLQDNMSEKTVDMKRHEDILRRAFQEGKKKYTAENLEKQKAFLEENKTKEGVITLESGLQYKVLKKGDENSKQPAKDSKVKVIYEGIALGQENNFDSSNGNAVELSLENVIDGWKEIVPMMHIGDEFEIYIPANLGYGENGINYSGQEIIPPNALLTFKIELTEIVEAEDKKEENAPSENATSAGTSESGN